MTQERFEAARIRYESQTKVVIADTPKLAAEYSVPVGTTVFIKNPQFFTLDAQSQLDDFFYNEFIRNTP